MQGCCSGSGCTDARAGMLQNSGFNTRRNQQLQAGSQGLFGWGACERDGSRKHTMHRALKGQCINLKSQLPCSPRSCFCWAHGSLSRAPPSPRPSLGAQKLQEVKRSDEHLLLD